MSNERFYFGIDLGTTNSVAACYDAAKKSCNTLIHHLDSSLLKSQIWRDTDGLTKVGAVPKKKVLSSVDKVKNVKSSMLLNSKFVYGPDELSAVEVSSMVLAELKDLINKQYAEIVGHSITDVTITVPAAFNNTQRQNTIKAANAAGLKVISLINEPTAAALAYADTIVKSETVLIYDLGGGTFDVSIVSISPNIPALKLPMLDIDEPAVERKMVTVLRSDGDTNLGGNDLDRLIVEEAISAVEGIRVTNEELQIAIGLAQRLKEKGGTGYQNIQFGETTVGISSATFDLATTKIYSKTNAIVKRLMDSVGAVSIDRIVLVGGSTKNKRLYQEIRAHFKDIPIFNDINPDECVAIGAAYNSYILGGEGDNAIAFKDVVSGTLGITVISDNEVEFQKMINKGEPLPAIKTLEVRKTSATQTEIVFPVYQGENIDFRLNSAIGELIIPNVPHDVTIDEIITCTLKVDTNGVLTVSAKLRGALFSAVIDTTSVGPAQEKDEMLTALEDFMTHEFLR